ncbi:MAG: HutP family protein [Halanaerobiales bacterium]|nr:HutP family protein [Halanaerobiales bacterium]
MSEPNVNLLSDAKMKIGKAALLLTLTSSRQEETELKKFLKERYNYHTVVTEVGGVLKNVKDKVVKSVVSAALNAGILEKKSSHIHPLIHATLEAERGMMFDIPTHSSIVMKVAIVVGRDWLAVAMYGESAIHILSNHERAGLGVMHV